MTINHGRPWLGVLFIDGGPRSRLWPTGIYLFLLFFNSKNDETTPTIERCVACGARNAARKVRHESIRENAGPTSLIGRSIFATLRSELGRVCVWDKGRIRY